MKQQEITPPYSSRKLLPKAKKLSLLEKAGYVLALYGSFHVVNHSRAIGYCTNFLQQSATMIDDITLGIHGHELWDTPFIYLSAMAAIKFHIIFVGQAVTQI